MKKSVTILLLVMIVLLVGCNSEKVVPNEVSSTNKVEEEIKEKVQVDLAIVEEYDQMKGLKFHGSTNLPSDMKLVLDISNKNGFTYQSTVIVQNGMFSSEWFEEKPGDYEVLVTSPTPKEQSEVVKETIGEEDELLFGEHVSSDSNENNIKALIPVSYHEKEEQPFKYDPSTAENTQDSTARSVDEDAVYQYIMQEFDVITNYGENYVPEVHDPIVVEKASKHFGMTVSEVDKIFMDKAMQLP